MPSSPTRKKEGAPLAGAPLYFRWLSLLCAVMALFCVGVFVIGYKDPSFGRVATLVALIVASVALLLASKRLSR
ncbi:MAG: hypothetical protein UCH28_10515 [Adlercreutzia sp.]|nr:hypothetical protein [Adlercreutzia sp.]